MKTYCKKVDITNPDIIKPWVLKAFDKKWKRGDFSSLLIKYGEMSADDLKYEIENNIYNKRLRAIDLISIEVANRIKNKQLDLKPIRCFKRLDGLSGKVRLLCKETAMQQIMDYIAVGALEELFNAKIEPHQYASIPGRGQTLGKKTIEKWVRRDISNSRHVRKGDISKCYESIKPELIIKLLSRDIHKNKTLIWFVDNILSNHKNVTNGIAIGSYLSQWLCNYVLSYLYRYINNLYKIRNKRNGQKNKIRLVKHVLFYMDDFIIVGPRAADVDKTMKLAMQYAKSELGLTIKNTWQKLNLKYGSIDMMGFVIRFDRTTIRRRIFKRLRRQFLRAKVNLEKTNHVPIWRARKIISYNGYFIYTNTMKAYLNLSVKKIVRESKKSIKLQDSKERS